MGLSSLKFLWLVPNMHVFWNGVRNGRSKLYKVTDFGTNRQRVCNFLLVTIATLVLSINQFQSIYLQKQAAMWDNSPSTWPPSFILPRFTDIAGFLLRWATPPIFHPIWGVSFGLDCRCCGLEERRPQANYSRNYCRTNRTHTLTLHQPRRQTDGQTDGRTTFYSNIAQRTECIAR